MIKYLKDILIQYFSVQLRHINCTELQSYSLFKSYHIKVAGQEYILQKLNTDYFFDVTISIQLFQNNFQHLNKNNFNYALPKIVKNKLGHQLTMYKDEVWCLTEILPELTTLQTVQNTKQAQQIGKALAQFHYVSQNFEVEPYTKTLPQVFYTEHIIADFEFALQITEDANIEEAHDVIIYLQDRLPVILQTDAIAKVQFPKKLIHGQATLQSFMFNPQDEVALLTNWHKSTTGSILYDYTLMLKSVSALQALDCTLNEIPLFSTEFALAAHQAYMSEIKNVLTPIELEHLESYYKMIILLESMQYVTQFLLGNKKIKALYYTQNLKKATNQILLHQLLSDQVYS